MDPNSNTAVVFDLGKVLLDFDYRIAARRLAATGHLTPEAVKHLIDHSPLLFRFETGLMTAGDFYSAVREATGYDGTIEEFARCFGEIFEEIPAMIRLNEDLRACGRPTYIFSNTNEIAVTHIRRDFPFFANFSDFIFSYEERSMKPDAKIYESVEARTGRKGQDIVYIDDRAENIAAGAARGWRVILQETPETTISKIRGMGLLR
jgi:FMN phosphatase YigB (HAD superfamily)